MHLFRVILLVIASSFAFDAAAMQQNINTLPYQQQLLTAIQNKDIGQVQSLLQMGLNPNFELGPLLDFQGNSPIAFASNGNNADIMQLLLQNGANPNTI